jgi:hypothetical protein
VSSFGDIDNTQEIGKNTPIPIGGKPFPWFQKERKEEAVDVSLISRKSILSL